MVHNTIPDGVLAFLHAVEDEMYVFHLANAVGQPVVEDPECIETDRVSGKLPQAHPKPCLRCTVGYPPVEECANSCLVYIYVTSIELWKCTLKDDTSSVLESIHYG